MAFHQFQTQLCVQHKYLCFLQHSFHRGLSEGPDVSLTDNNVVVCLGQVTFVSNLFKSFLICLTFMSFCVWSTKCGLVMWLQIQILMQKSQQASPLLVNNHGIVCYFKITRMHRAV